MEDLTFAILLRKYAPNDLRLTEVVVEKQTAGPSEDLALLQSYNITTVVDGGKTFTVLMSSADYEEKVISEVCDEYNRLHPEHKSYSYQLPATMLGIPANSWVLALPEGGMK